MLFFVACYYNSILSWHLINHYNIIILSITLNSVSTINLNLQRVSAAEVIDTIVIQLFVSTDVKNSNRFFSGQKMYVCSCKTTDPKKSKNNPEKNKTTSL